MSEEQRFIAVNIYLCLIKLFCKESSAADQLLRGRWIVNLAKAKVQIAAPASFIAPLDP